MLNENITKAGESVQALRSALLGALSHADPVTTILLRGMVEDSTRLEARLMELDAALVEAGRDGE